MKNTAFLIIMLLLVSSAVYAAQKLTVDEANAAKAQANAICMIKKQKGKMNVPLVQCINKELARLKAAGEPPKDSK